MAEKKSKRQKHATFKENGKGKFPIANKSDAMDALRLRGHGTNKQQRRKVINKAAKFAPEAAKKARKRDKENNKI
ncbi:MAG: hypothetical protein ABEK59_11430 [Halobacteria archaeon]